MPYRCNDLKPIPKYPSNRQEIVYLLFDECDEGSAGFPCEIADFTPSSFQLVAERVGILRGAEAHGDTAVPRRLHVQLRYILAKKQTSTTLLYNICYIGC